MQGDAFKESREKFFDGAGPRPALLLNQPRRPKEFKHWTAGERMNLIDPRLRSVVVRACRNSYAASKVVELLEDCVVSTFRGDEDWILIPTTASSSDDDNKNKMWWQGLLLQSPMVTKSIDEDAREQEGVLLRTRYQVQFLFDAETPTGGFHRLLLQAICQFHGLRTASRMVHGTPTVDGTSISQARVLTATGCLKHERAQNIRLLNHLSNDHELSHPQLNATSSLTKEMAILKV